MPTYWYRTKENEIKDEDDEETIKLKEFRRKLVAIHKPYFMIYVYPTLKSDYTKYIKNTDTIIGCRYSDLGIMNISDLEKFEPKTEEMNTLIDFYYKRMPVGLYPCVVNRIARLIESEFANSPAININGYYDWERLKCGVDYSIYDYRNIAEILLEYQAEFRAMTKAAKSDKVDTYEISVKVDQLYRRYYNKILTICSSQDIVCDILVDYCYKTGRAKDLMWKIAGRKIISNLLKYSNGWLSYPVRDDNGEFEFGGDKFTMRSIKVEVQNDYSK